MVKVTFPDGSAKEYADDITPLDIAREISKGLAKHTIGAKVNGVIRDADRPLTGLDEIELELLKDDDTDNPDVLHLIRHSASHIMAEAILDIWPDAQLVYGPAVEDGFYYDIDLDTPITDKDFDRIEQGMRRIIKRNKPFVRIEMPRDKGMAKVKEEGSPYKIDNAERAEGDTLSFYRTGEDEGGFEDLCAGPHVPSTGKVGAVKIMSVAGAYWHGDAAQQQLQRVYGTAFPTQQQLDAYLERLEEARKRDHRVLGKKLDIFSVEPEIGPGLILWHPNGSIVRHQVESFWRDEHLARGYQLVYTPHMASEAIYKASGHLEKYGDMMFSPMDIDGTDYYIKPMNCPGHIKIYKSRRRSYRELPLRWCELGTVYRYEPSGTLHGMLRVRGFTQDDSHIFCTIEQLADEVAGVLDLVDVMMARFGYEYSAFLATRPEKYLGTDEEWEWATSALVKAMEMRQLDYEVDEGGGVFYAPKIDIKLRDSLGREWQGPTIQVDLNLPKRFDVNYIGADNAEHRVVMIHRTVLGSMERFVGGLVEHYAGAFPVWLAPEQVRVLPVSEKFNDYGEKVYRELRGARFRAALDDGDEKVGAKIRRAREDRVPYMLIVGEREAETGTVSVRQRSEGEQGVLSVADFIADLRSRPGMG